MPEIKMYERQVRNLRSNCDGSANLRITDTRPDLDERLKDNRLIDLGSNQKVTIFRGFYSIINFDCDLRPNKA